jgi:methionine sulfoxide reductase heme-binding subunit
VLALTSPYLWYTTRATGMVTLVLFTLVVALGMLVSNRVGGTMFGRFEVNELHRSLSMVAMVFLVIHILTTIVDSYVSTGWFSAVIPFISAYRTIGVTLGAVAFDLMLAVWISSLIKVRIKNESWRAIHWLSWLAFASAIVHAYMTGTDAKDGLGLALVVACAALVLGAAIWRYLARPTRAAGRTALSPLAVAAPDDADTASSAVMERPVPERARRRR